MSTEPNQELPENRASQLAKLLGSGLSPAELTWQLFQINYEQALTSDPRLAFVLRACAIPAQFDATVIGALRDAREAIDENSALLIALQQYSFVQLLPDGAYAYHDTTRDVVLAEWQTDLWRSEYEVLRQRLSSFYLERGKQRSDQNDYAGALQDFSRALEISTQHAELYRLRAEAQADLGNYEAALQDAQQSIELA